MVGPDWRPTESMRKRDPQLPEYMPPGPDNPLGTHALYLSWPNYRIHGTSDTRKIGRAVHKLLGAWGGTWDASYSLALGRDPVIFQDSTK